MIRVFPSRRFFAVAALLLLMPPGFAAFGATYVVGSARDADNDTSSRNGNTGAATTNAAANAAINRANAILQNSNATTAEIQSATAAVNSIVQRALANGTADQGTVYRSSDDGSSAGSSGPAIVTPGASSGPAIVTPSAPTLSPAERAQQAQLAREAAQAQQALQTMAATRAERERLQNAFVQGVELALNAPAGSAPQDTEYSQGAQPGNFRDVAAEYAPDPSAGNGGTAPAPNYLDRTQGQPDGAAMDDGPGDTEAPPPGSSPLQWLRDLRQSISSTLGNLSPSAAIGRAANSDLPQPLPPADDPDIGIDPVDPIKWHPVWDIPYIKVFMDPILDSAKRHYHYDQDHPNGR